MSQPENRLVPARGRPDLLRVYLNDHLAGAVGGAALARRLAGSHRDTAAGAELTGLADEVGRDRDSLVSIMADLGIRPAPYKPPLALLAERVGRLKLNGSVLRRSPLSTVVELEGLTLGATGKLAAWRSLRALSASDPRLDAARLDELIARAQRQLELLERLRVRAVTEALQDES